MKKIRVLVVDDSAFMRRVISDIIRVHPELEVMDTARDGITALEKIKARRPDVVTMDLEMPRLDGLETMKRIMVEHPLPVIMLSTHTKVGSEVTLKALDAGAVDFMSKPTTGSSIITPEESMEELKNILPQKIIAASSAEVRLITAREPVPAQKPVNKTSSTRAHGEKARVIIAIGASTGGPKVLEKVFSGLPANLPAAVLLSQHMPPGFTLSFAQRLDMMSPLKVKEAENGDALLKGHALVAPGGYHMVIKNELVTLDVGPRVNYVRPAIDVMLESLVDCDQKMVVVILTGMGKDGAGGTVALKERKKDSIVIVQDPATALIPSMPAAVIKTGLCDHQASIERLSVEVDRYTRILV